MTQSQKYGARNGRGARRICGFTDFAPSNCPSSIMPSLSIRSRT